MPHRPLFVSQCHHFSLVIYFIAILVSLLHPPPPFLLLHLRSPSLPSRSSHRSLSFTLSHPSRAPCLQTPSRSKLSTMPHDATQFHSPHPPGDFIICFCHCRYFFSLFSSLSFILAVSLRLFFRSHQRHLDDDAECEKEGEEMRDRARS